MFNMDEEEQMVIFRECGCSVRKARGMQQDQPDKLQLIFNVIEILSSWACQLPSMGSSVRENIFRYLNRLEMDGVGPEGCLTKLDNIYTGVEFIQNCIH